MDSLKLKLTKYTVDEIKSLESKAFKRGPYQKKAIKSLVKVLPIIEFGFKEVGNIYRCRLNTHDDPYSNLRDLLWRPKTNIANHRLSSSEVVYFSSKPQTAILETISDSDIEIPSATLISITSKYDSRLFCFGEIHHMVKHNMMSISDDPNAKQVLEGLISSLSPELGLRWALIDAIIYHLISSYDRNISQITSKEVFKELHTNTIICFPSTRDKGGINFAIKPKTIIDNFQICGGLNVKRVEHFGYGIYEIIGDLTLTSIDSKSKLYWTKIDKDFNGKSMNSNDIDAKYLNKF